MTENLGALADDIYAMKEEIAAADAVAADLRSKRNELESKLMSLMDEAGTDIVRGNNATCSISKVNKFRVGDFTELEKVVYRKKLLHLFEKRLSSVACQELKDSLGGKMISGVIEVEVANLNVRRKG